MELSCLVYGGGGGVRAIMSHQEQLVILGDLREKGAQIMLEERVGEVGVGLVDGGLLGTGGVISLKEGSTGAS